MLICMIVWLYMYDIITMTTACRRLPQLFAIAVRLHASLGGRTVYYWGQTMILNANKEPPVLVAKVGASQARNSFWH